MDSYSKLSDLVEPYLHTQSSMDQRMIGIMRDKREYEQRLDEMWQNYCRGNMRQVVEYKAQVKYIKEANLEVLRSKSTGKHKIVYKNRR